MKKLLIVSILLLAMTHTTLSAKEKTMEELSKGMSNPLVQIWNLSFQNNYTTVKADGNRHGMNISGKDHVNTTLFQGV